MAVKIVVNDAAVTKHMRQIAKDIPDGVLGRVYNKGARQKGRRYDLFVMSDKRQATIHRDRWPTELQIARASTKPVREMYKRSLTRSLRGRGAQNKKATEEALDYLMNEVTEEAYKTPQPPGSRYVRTRTLYRAWAKENNIR